MSESELPDNDVDESSPVPAENREGRVVIDFTVGPAGVGPATGITPVDVRELHSEEPPVE